jgi:predicted enzyme related to lactoylglutathione lyase
MPDPLIRKIDCLQIPVPDLEAALSFYGDELGHALIWRTPTAAGLRLPDSDAEVVLQTERSQLEANLTVASADQAVERFVAAGGTVIRPPFDIQIGRCAVVADPWGNVLVLLDNSKVAGHRRRGQRDGYGAALMVCHPAPPYHNVPPTHPI